MGITSDAIKKMNEDRQKEEFFKAAVDAQSIILQDWTFICPFCGNKTFTGKWSEKYMKDKIIDDRTGLTRYLNIYVLECGNCKKIITVGSYFFCDRVKGWAACGMYSGGRPYEYLAFQTPNRQISLPSVLKSEIKQSFKEALHNLDYNQTMSAGAMIRNTLRLIIEDQGIEEDNLDQAIDKLRIDSESKKLAKNLKAFGDLTLHFEDFKRDELEKGVLCLIDIIEDIYGRQQRRLEVEKIITKKHTKRDNLNNLCKNEQNNDLKKN